MVAGAVGEGDGYGGYRGQLVETLQGKGIRDLSVLRAIRMVPRHLFVPESVRHRAYDDVALPIGKGQTISQPYVQARYLELIGLGGRERVLEIGAGSGYQTALLALLSDSVFGVERIPSLAQGSRAALEAAGIRNATILVGDGTLGWRPYAPYDAILVAAASPDIPAPLVEQLAPEGRMVIPLGDRAAQTLTLVRRQGDEVRVSALEDVRFVPLLGEFGFSPNPGDMLNDFFHWLAATVLALGYPGIVLLMAVESSLLPLPSELVMPPAGYLAAKGQMNPWLALAAGTAGSVIGALLNYALAVFVGEPILRRYGKYVLMSERSLDRTEAFFRRHGEISTFVGRLLPVIRHLISIPAGISRMALGRFVAFTALGAGIWCGILTYLGWLIGRHGEEVDAVIGKYVHHTLVSYILPATVVLVAGYVFWRRRQGASAG